MADDRRQRDFDNLTRAIVFLTAFRAGRSDLFPLLVRAALRQGTLGGGNSRRAIPSLSQRLDLIAQAIVVLLKLRDENFQIFARENAIDIFEIHDSTPNARGGALPLSSHTSGP